MNNARFCDETACIRKVFAPHIYCDKHQDKASTPLIEAEVLATLHEIYPDWQHVKLTRIGYAEQRMSTIFKLKDYIIKGKK